jgi:hypothetical protein
VSALHGYPQVGELVEAVREFLVSAQPLTGTDYASRVAASALDIVRRELESGARDEQAHQARLAALGFADEATLATAIRTGAQPFSTALRAALLADAQDRLRVVNPRFVAAFDDAPST